MDAADGDWFVIDGGSKNMRIGYTRDGGPTLMENRKEDIEHLYENGVISDCSLFGELIERLCDDNGWNLKNQKVIVTEPVLNTVDNRVQLLQFFFDKLHVEELHLISQPAAALCEALGRVEDKTGIVVNIGSISNQYSNNKYCIYGYG